ncbi:phosphatidate cytidylyltransferase [Thermodesulfobacteriota bacterium]
MLRKKVATGLTLAVIFVLAIWRGPLTFWYGLIGVIAVVGVLEYASMIPSVSAARKILVFLPACLMPITGVCLLGEIGLMTGVAAGFLWISILCLPWRSDIGAAMESQHRLVFGILYLGMLPSFFLLLMQEGLYGRKWIFLILIAAYMGDTAAYFTGRTFGHAKLSPNVSPNKTWEGAAGGLLGSIVGVSVFSRLAFDGIALWQGAVLAVVLGVAAQAGDLVESLIKRNADVKDSGSFLPGHGGVLDRVDSAIFALPVGYYAMKLLFHP